MKIWAVQPEYSGWKRTSDICKRAVAKSSAHIQLLCEVFQYQMQPGQLFSGRSYQRPSAKTEVFLFVS